MTPRHRPVPEAGLPGGCLCGAIRYRLIEEPFALYACHCTDCQVQTGSSFGLSMFVRREGIVVEQGEPAEFQIQLADGRPKHAAYCAKCAARLWGLPASAPTIRVLRPGTLDAPRFFSPVGHIWTSSAHAWIALPEDQPRYEGQPADMSELIRAWQAARGSA